MAWRGVAWRTGSTRKYFIRNTTGTGTRRNAFQGTISRGPFLSKEVGRRREGREEGGGRRGVVVVEEK